jgi:hypothetical protein
MLTRTDTSTVAPVDPVRSLPPLGAVGDARQQAFDRALIGRLGQSMQAQVLTKLTDGSFIVKVAGASARMMLPAGVAAGAEVPLTLVSLTPRPTFEISTGAGSAPARTTAESAELAFGATAQEGDLAGDAHALPQARLAEAQPGAARALSHAAALLGKAPITPSALLPALGAEDGASASLSKTGRLLAAVLGAAQPAEAGPTTIVARSPLVGGAGAPAAQLAQALQDSVGSSGLFYESHLAEWADGKRAMADLAPESQLRNAGSARMSDGAAADPATATFISGQLSVQEHASVAWQGQVWPGQQMECTISKEPPRQQSGGEPAQAPWRSTLQLRFALLGEVGASLVLHEGRLHVQLDAPGEDVRQLLRLHAPKFGEALEAAGIALSGLGIDTRAQ